MSTTEDGQVTFTRADLDRRIEATCRTIGRWIIALAVFSFTVGVLVGRSM